MYTLSKSANAPANYFVFAQVAVIYSTMLKCFP